MKEIINAVGHENVTAEHSSTFEVTTDDYLTPAGDCILAIEADRAPADFDPEFVAACRDPRAEITATINVGEYSTAIVGRGHPDLTLSDGRSLVGRTSEYVDERTVMVNADRAAGDLDRSFVSALAGGAAVTLALRVEA